MCFSELRERSLHCASDVEHATVAAKVAMLGPLRVSLQLVNGIEPAFLHQTLRQAKRHRGIVSPLAGLEVEGTATDHVSKFFEGTRGFEFESGSDGVSNCEAEQCAPKF